MVDFLSFLLVFLASTLAVILFAVAAPVAVGLSAISSLARGKKNVRSWRAAPAV